MGLLDPVFNALGQTLDILEDTSGPIIPKDTQQPEITDTIAEVFLRPQGIEHDPDRSGTEQVAVAFDAITPVDELTTTVVDIIEETILVSLQSEGELTPENVERIADETEGTATAVLIGFGALGTIVESLTAGQVEGQTEIITQALAGLGIDDVTGLEMDARIQEGIQPALEAKVGKEHRSKFVDLQDAVELALRSKEGDVGFLSPENAPPDVVNAIGSNEPVNPDNLLEEWGVRDDQLPILEEVAISEIEFEELLETPSELGLPVPGPILENELDRAGYAEDTKEFLAETADAVTKTARTYQELLVSEELVGALDTLVRDDVLTPLEALGTIPEDVPADDDAFQQRFELLQELPAGAPSASDFEGAFASGFISLDQLRGRLDATEYPTEQFEPVLRKTVLDELDGDLQTAVGLGLLDEAAYSDFAEFAGLDDETVELLLQGQGTDKIAKSRLQENADPASRAVGTIVGIGESRARALGGVGIETVADLAGADVETVAEAAQVSPETAEQFIQQARRRTR